MAGLGSDEEDVRDGRGLVAALDGAPLAEAVAAARRDRREVGRIRIVGLCEEACAGGLEERVGGVCGPDVAPGRVGLEEEAVGGDERAGGDALARAEGDAVDADGEAEREDARDVVRGARERVHDAPARAPEAPRALQHVEEGRPRGRGRAAVVQEQRQGQRGRARPREPAQLRLEARGLRGGGAELQPVVVDAHLAERDDAPADVPPVCRDGRCERGHVRRAEAAAPRRVHAGRAVELGRACPARARRAEGHAGRRLLHRAGGHNQVRDPARVRPLQHRVHVGCVARVSVVHPLVHLVQHVRPNVNVRSPHRLCFFFSPQSLVSHSAFWV